MVRCRVAMLAIVPDPTSQATTLAASRSSRGEESGSGLTPDRLTRVLSTIIWCTGAAVATFSLTTAYGTANLAGAGQFVRDFVTSAGFGGLAALAAASLAYFGIRRQARIARDALTHEQNVERARKWWSTFQWTADRALPPNKEAVALPPQVAITTLQELAVTAVDDAQRLACGGLVTELGKQADDAKYSSGSLSDEGSPTDQDHSQAGTRNDEVEAALSSYALATNGSAAESAIARRRAYESQVRDAVASIAAEAGLEYESSARLGLFGNPDLEDRFQVDGTITEDHNTFALVEVVAFERAGARIIQRLQKLRENRTYPVLFIAPIDEPDFIGDGAHTPPHWVKWNPGDDPKVLRDALIRVLQSNQR